MEPINLGAGDGVMRIISALHGGHELLSKWKAERDATNLTLSTAEQQGQVTAKISLETSPRLIRHAYDGGYRKFGHQFASGDPIASALLLNILRQFNHAIQTIFHGVRPLTHAINTSRLIEETLQARTRTINALHELGQRLLAARITPQPSSHAGNNRFSFRCHSKDTPLYNPPNSSTADRLVYQHPTPSELHKEQNQSKLRYRSENPALYDPLGNLIAGQWIFQHPAPSGLNQGQSQSSIRDSSRNTASYHSPLTPTIDRPAGEYLSTWESDENRRYSSGDFRWYASPYSPSAVRSPYQYPESNDLSHDPNQHSIFRGSDGVQPTYQSARNLERRFQAI